MEGMTKAEIDKVEAGDLAGGEPAAPARRRQR